MDSVSHDKRSEIMRRVKSKETRLENKLRSQLWKLGVHYRKNNQYLFGKPDISIKSKKVVIFIDSCFWHGCAYHLRMPKSNIEYWSNKIERNRSRDALVNKHYQSKNWNIIRIWEHDLRKSPSLTAEK